MKRIILLLGLVALMCLSSCRQVKYIEVPVTHDVIHNTTTHDTVEREHIKYVYTSGDTVYNNDTIRELKKVYVHDSVFVHDSISYPVPEPYPVEKQLSWMQKTLMYSGVAAVLGLAAFLIYIIIIRPRVRR